jgi:hypothetical protein
MRSKGGVGTRHEAFAWDVANDKAAEALEAVASEKASWGLLFWVALMTGADDEGIIRPWSELVQQKVAGPWMKANLAGIALLFAELAGRYLVWERALEGWGMIESQVANSWRAMGELKKARDWLLRLLRAKYKTSVSADIQQIVEQQTDVNLLNRWYDLALEADTWEVFVAGLK